MTYALARAVPIHGLICSVVNGAMKIFKRDAVFRHAIPNGDITAAFTSTRRSKRNFGLAL